MHTQNLVDANASRRSPPIITITNHTNQEVMASGSDTDEASSNDCFTDTARIKNILRNGSDTDEESSKDRFTDTARIKSILRDETSPLRVNGDFASAGIVNNATDPQISRNAPVNGSQCSTSVIELPLCEEDANSLFPERRKTIVGQGPNPWVAAAENIEIGNETFMNSVTGLLTDLKTSLGIPEHVQLIARLNHLALFERGDVSTDSLQYAVQIGRALSVLTHFAEWPIRQSRQDFLS